MIHLIQAKQAADKMLANKPKPTKEDMAKLDEQIGYWPQIILIAVIGLIAIATI